MVEARNSEFGAHIDHLGTNEKCKFRSKGSGRGHMTYFCNVATSSIISVTVEARNFKFGASM